MRNIWWIVGVAAVVWIGAYARAAVVSPLMTAFRSTKARPLGYSVNDWVSVKHRQESLKSLASRESALLHLPGIPKARHGTGYQKLSLTHTVNHIKTSLIVERLVSGQTFVVMDRTSPNSFTGLRETSALFKTLLEPYGAVHNDINLEGVLPGHLSATGEKALIDSAFQAIGAQRVNGLATAGYIAYAGYSSLISASDQLQGHPVNIQVAITYNTYLRQTEVLVGSPLVTVTY